VVRGRSYTATEVAGREKVAVISERLAHRFWRDEDPLGASASRIDSLYAGVRIIGIVEDAFVDSVDERRPPTIYLPFLPEAFAQIAIRTANPEALAGAVKQALDELSPGITVKTAVIADEYRRQFERPRRHAALGACAAVFALVLSVAGLVGVTSFAMRTRVREIGIRLALGARPAEIRRLLVRDALRPVMAGLIVGVGASLLAGRTVASLFYGLSERDPAALVSATAVLLLTTLAAVMVPVRRAARLDPAVVLRDS
jgi:ABC-type lipoprotein release transport system permease subunit